MIPSLPLFHPIAGKPVIVLGDGEAALAKQRLVERAGGVIVGEDNQQARIAFVALDEPESTVAKLKARGLLCNVPDRPELCDFTVPSILDRSPLLLAIGTGGASAGLAKAVRLRLETLLPQTLGKLADALAEARPAMRKRWAVMGERRRALDLALGEGGVLDPLREESAQKVAEWLSGCDSMGAELHEIQLTSSDPEDLTLRQARLLGSADLIAYELGVAPEILDRARADAERHTIELGAAAPECDGLCVIIRLPN